jgi:hypothetical protein
MGTLESGHRIAGGAEGWEPSWTEAAVVGVVENGGPWSCAIGVRVCRFRIRSSSIPQKRATTGVVAYHPLE